MSRPSGKSRVGNGPEKAPVQGSQPTMASMRHRRPFMFWMVVIATGAMILATFGSLLSAFV